MTNTQLYLAIGVPIVFNGLMILLLATLLTRHTDRSVDLMNKRMEDGFAALNRRIDDVRADIHLLVGKIMELMEKR